MQEVPVRCYKQEPIKKSKSEKLTQKSSSKTDNNNNNNNNNNKWSCTQQLQLW
jgi:hypothetical protein